MAKFEDVKRIATKSRALQHCNKLLEKIDKKGYADVPVNCTGLVFHVEKDDPLYLRLQQMRATLVVEINALEIKHNPTQISFQQTIAVDNGALSSPAVMSIEPANSETHKFTFLSRKEVAALPAEEKASYIKARKSEYNRRYREKNNHSVT